MVQAIINLNENANRILNIVKVLQGRRRTNVGSFVLPYSIDENRGSSGSLSMSIMTGCTSRYSTAKEADYDLGW